MKGVPPAGVDPQLDPSHPIHMLLFYVDDDVEQEAVDHVRRLVDRLRFYRSWVLGPPEFVDETDSEVLAPGDEPVRTVGCFLRIYSSLSPWRERLPVGVDRTQLEEVQAVMEAVEAVSGGLMIDFAVEVDHDQVGWIHNGVPDEGLRRGLLDEWEAHVRLREGQVQSDQQDGAT